jgi:hypothetical protein
MASKYTDWFPAGVDPVHAGRYQRRPIGELAGSSMGDGVWRDGQWFRTDGRPSLFACEWRGLRRRPRASTPAPATTAGA